jgi:hypothetical protein
VTGDHIARIRPGWARSGRTRCSIGPGEDPSFFEGVEEVVAVASLRHPTPDAQGAPRRGAARTSDRPVHRIVDLRVGSGFDVDFAMHRDPAAPDPPLFSHPLTPRAVDGDDDIPVTGDPGAGSGGKRVV